MDLLDLFDRGTAWSRSKVSGALDALDASTPCEEWAVRDLLNHMLDSQRIFRAAAGGEPPAPSSGPPPDLLGDDPVAQYEEARQATLAAFREPDAIDSTGPTLGIAFVDQLVHGWDLAAATGQDSTIPSDLAEAAFAMVDGRMADDQRGSLFKPAVAEPADGTAQAKLLAYLGRRVS